MGLGTQSVIFDLDGSNKGKFYGNEVSGNSGGGLNSFVSLMGDAVAYQNLFVSNTSWTGVACSGGAVYNNYILDNSVNLAVNAYGDCDVLNNTIVGNSINAGSTYAAVYMSNDTNKVSNNLIAYNTGNQSFYHHSSDTSVFEYNALYNNGTDPAASSLADGNLLCDPLFGVTTYTNPDVVIYGEGSECIDMGKVESLVTVDYFDTARALDGDGVAGVQYDPGAYEAPTYTVPSVTTAPEITGLGVSPATFSPDSDGTADLTVISFNISENADLTVTILNSSDVEIKKIVDGVAQSAGSVLLSWDGMNELSQVAEDGTYKVKVEITNTNGDDSAEVSVEIDTTGQASGNKCAGYTDVPASHPSCDAIEYMQSVGAMTGNPNGSFAPNDLLQRDQVAKIVLETFGLFDAGEDYCNGTDPFPDVKSTDWAYQYICRGVELGMITGHFEFSQYRSFQDHAVHKLHQPLLIS